MSMISKLTGTISRNRARELALAYADYRQAIQAYDDTGFNSEKLTISQIRRVWAALRGLDTWQRACGIEIVDNLQDSEVHWWTVLQARTARL